MVRAHTHTSRHIPNSAVITAWPAAPFERGRIYTADDVRGEYVFFATSVPALQVAIHEWTSQRVSTTSLYDALHGKLKKEITSSFRIRSMRRDEAIGHINNTRFDCDWRVFGGNTHAIQTDAEDEV